MEKALPPIAGQPVDDADSVDSEFDEDEGPEEAGPGSLLTRATPRPNSSTKEPSYTMDGKQGSNSRWQYFSQFFYPYLLGCSDDMVCTEKAGQCFEFEV